MKILPAFRLWCSGLLLCIFALKKTGASWSKCLQDIHPPSSWYQRTVYPTCFSQLRNPHLKSSVATFSVPTSCDRFRVEIVKIFHYITSSTFPLIPIRIEFVCNVFYHYSCVSICENWHSWCCPMWNTQHLCSNSDTMFEARSPFISPRSSLLCSSHSLFISLPVCSHCQPKMPVWLALHPLHMEVSKLHPLAPWQSLICKAIRPIPFLSSNR